MGNCIFGRAAKRAVSSIDSSAFHTHSLMDSLKKASDDLAVQGSGLIARFLPLAVGLAAIWLTYAIVSGNLGQLTKFAVAGLSACYAAAYAAVSVTRIKADTRPTETAVREPEAWTNELVEKLSALDEANEVFGTTLNAADMFRLVSSRVREIIPFAASALLIPDEVGSALRYVHVDGAGAEHLRGLEIERREGLAGRSFETGRIEIDYTLSREVECRSEMRMNGMASSISIPMTHEDETFAILQLFTAEPVASDDKTIKILEAVSEHVTPIFRNSLAFERTLSGALTDSLTGLPNDRAFRMVLENQLAESARRREERPLAILSIDIRDFGAVNSMLGHAAGDRMLEFVGSCIGRTLRKMDFLARTINDEFNIILPLASEAVAYEVVERIKCSFDQNEFEIADGEGIRIELNVGWATFWKDGETPDQLLRAAQQRKRQARSESPAGVLWFPREYVN